MGKVGQVSEWRGMAWIFKQPLLAWPVGGLAWRGKARHGLGFNESH